MSLNPSNETAKRENPGKTLFRNLAMRWSEDSPDQEALKQLDDAIRAELIAAGLLDAEGKGDPGNFMEREWNRKNGGEVPTAIFIARSGWVFTRRWYYYAASGPGIPPLIAEEFHKEWGTEVRVEGHCGCPSPLEYCNGFAVGSYHIDTQEGLNAFVKLLASIDNRKDQVATSVP